MIHDSGAKLLADEDAHGYWSGGGSNWRETCRPPGSGAPDYSRCRLAWHLVIERDTALQWGLELAELLENFGRAPKDRPLDAGKNGTNVTVSLDWAGCSRIVWARSNTSSVWTGATTLMERLRSAKSPQQAPVRVGPRAERRQGVMAGIGVDEQRAVGGSAQAATDHQTPGVPAGSDKAYCPVTHVVS